MISCVLEIQAHGSDMASSVPLPVIVIPAFDQEGASSRAQSAKYFASSLLRGLFAGSIVIGRNTPSPIFKSGRTDVREIFCDEAGPVTSLAERRAAEERFLGRIAEWISPEERQWVVIADPATLALRNPDHLFPEELAGPYTVSQPDFLWTGVTQGSGSLESGLLGAGLFAIRGKFLSEFIELWKTSESGDLEMSAEVSGWERVLGSLGGRKAKFEFGEVMVPSPGALDWRAVSQAAVVSMIGWPPAECRSATRCLYLGQCLGNEMEIMLHLMEF